MTKLKITACILSWITSLAGALWALFVSLVLACSLVGAGHKFYLPLSVFVLPLVTFGLGIFALGSSGRLWFLVPPLCISAATVVLVALAWVTS